MLTETRDVVRALSTSLLTAFCCHVVGDARVTMPSNLLPTAITRNWTHAKRLNTGTRRKLFYS